MNREREAHKQLPVGSVRLQAFCRARPEELIYLGRKGKHFVIAATAKGIKLLMKEGLQTEPSGEVREDKPVHFVARA
jgi:hypothetical protein